MWHRSKHRDFTPVKINDLDLQNRFIRAAAFEVVTRGGAPTDQPSEILQGVAQGAAVAIHLGKSEGSR